jgi:hypothetical protein
VKGGPAPSTSGARNLRCPRRFANQLLVPPLPRPVCR